MSWLFNARPDTGRRLGAALVTLLVVTSVVITRVAVPAVLAQDNSPRVINIGDTLNGTMDAKTFAQAFAFDGKTGDRITITATSNTRGLSLALILTSPTGVVLNQSAELVKATLTMSDVALPEDGRYIITLLRGNGAQGTVAGSFNLALTGTAAAQTASTPTTSQVVLTQGMSIELSWATNDDFNLEVRDPVGGAVNFRTPSTTSGGKLDKDTNGNCATATADNPSETVNWSAGNVPAGSYEIIVYYSKACGTTPTATKAGTQEPQQATGDVPFSITVTVDGVASDPIRGSLSANKQYVSSFRVDAPDKVTVEAGGPNLSIDLAPFADKISAASTVTLGTAVTGTIDFQNPADAWSFDVAANAQPVTITMNATSGSLDTFLVLLGTDGNIVASNDDASQNTRNSEIANQKLGEGRYTVIATRFALKIGGTEGGYSLNVTSGRTAVSNAGTVPTLVPASTTASTTPTVAPLPDGSIQISLTWNTKADLRLLIRDPAGVSVFSDNATPNNSGVLDRLGNFKCTNPTTSPVTYAYWPPDALIPGTYEVSVWLQDRCNDTSVIQYKLNVKVKGIDVITTDTPKRPNESKLHYLTTFTVGQDGTATKGSAEGLVDNRFTADMTTQLNNNTPALSLATPVSGEINETIPFVVYTYQARRNDQISIVMRNTGGNLDPNLYLFSPDGKQQLANNDDVTPGKDANSKIVYKATADGTYIVIATRYGVQLGGTVGTYELTIAQTN
ncbi:MAG: PPC domain-containing protein [Chloroflexota bacterium]